VVLWDCENHSDISWIVAPGAYGTWGTTIYHNFGRKGSHQISPQAGDTGHIVLAACSYLFPITSAYLNIPHSIDFISNLIPKVTSQFYPSCIP